MNEINKHINYGSPITYKSIGHEIKADSGTRKVSGYLAAFDNRDSDGDIIMKGAFSKSLTERGVSSSTDRKISFLWQHDMSEPIGKFTELKEDDFGLYFEAEMSKIPLGDRVLTQYADGTLNQHSIGFRYVWDKMEYDESKDSYMIKEVNLFEGSVVTMGANENTPFTGMKSKDKEEHGRDLERQFEGFLKKFSESEAYEMRQYIHKYISLNEPSLDTPLAEPFDVMKAISNYKLK